MVNRIQMVPGVPLRSDSDRRWRRYVALGDSLSEGLGDPLARGAIRGWAYRLAEHLRRVEPRLEFTNLAVRGYLARHALRLQLEPAVRLRPDLVSVFIGGNDVMLRPAFEPERFNGELCALVSPFSGSATVILATLPDLTACSPLPPPLRGRVQRRIVAANDVIRQVAHDNATVLLDAWADPRTRKHAMWSIDRIHPSAEGHRLIAAGVADLLGIPADDDASPADVSLLATAGRYCREAAWLARYATRRVTPPHAP